MQEETAVLVMGDLHYGKRTASFDPDVFGQRLDKLASGLERVHGLLTTGENAYHFDRLKIVDLGDDVDGSEIYPTHGHHLAVSNVEQQAHDLADLMCGFTLRVKRTWKETEHVVVPGNHARMSRYAHEAANWDIVYHNYLRYMLAPSGIPVMANTESDPFLNKMTVRGHNYLLTHGAEINMYQGVPWYGIQRRSLQWLATKLAPIDVILMGHFHVQGMWRMSNLRLMTTGTMVSDDEWSRRMLGMEPSTAWWLFGVSDTRPITFTYSMELA